MVEFVYKYVDSMKRNCTLTAPITIPLTSSPHEYACQLMSVYKMPCYLESSLTKELEAFLAEETEKWHQRNAEEALRAVEKDESSIENLISCWNRAFTEEHIAFTKLEKISNEEVFSEMYHSLVHSPALDALLLLEHFYADQMGELVGRRDEDLRNLQSRQSKEMENAVQNAGISVTDEQVNALAVKQIEDLQMFESKWESEIVGLRDTQKRDFQKWIVKVHEDYHTSGREMAFPPSHGEAAHQTEGSETWITHPSRLEESFTIHLGAQLKQMHNLRLLSAHVLDLCRCKSAKARNAVPQRLQTAMTLYSNDLCGLVMLVDSRLNSYTGIKRDFARIGESSTEFHFIGLEDQLEDARELLSKVSHWRATTSLAVRAATAAANLSSFDSGSGNGSGNQSPKITSLKPGDVYMTRHSNLAEVHVLFHVVTDDSTRSSDISSRHPVILALRNVLKVACLCDVTNVTLPLLLVHEMSEEMTMSWCMKRAELIYKCVKGFMIEMASWGGSDSRTIQFIVPSGISEDLFSSLSTMLPSIFRMSNPLKVKI